MVQALSTRCGPRPRGLGACPSEGPVQGPLQSHGVSRAGVSLDKQRSDRGGAPIARSRVLADAGHLLCRRALNGFFSIGDVEVFDRVGAGARVCTYGVHALKTPPLVEIHNDGVGQFREQCRARSAQCVVRAHAAELCAKSQRVLARANGDPFARHVPQPPTHQSSGPPQSFIDDEISTVKDDSW